MVDNARVVQLLRSEIGTLPRRNELLVVHGDAEEERAGFWRRLDERIAARRPYLEDGGEILPTYLMRAHA